MRIIFIIFIFCNFSCSIQKEFVDITVCDTLSLENHYNNCLINNINYDDSHAISKLKKSDCKKEAHNLYCKPIKHIQYMRRNKIIKTIPCK